MSKESIIKLILTVFFLFLGVLVVLDAYAENSAFDIGLCSWIFVMYLFVKDLWQ